jgi:bacteriocin-like protein
MNNSEKIVIAELNNSELENISGGGLWADIKSFFGVKDDSFKGFGGGDFGGGGAGGSY